MKLQKKFDIAFIVLFLVVLVIPASKIDFKTEKSEKENRNLAGYEKLFSDEKINLNYGKSFEAWFNDRFFGRDFLLAVNAGIFDDKVIQNDLVMRGRKGWYFYLGYSSVKNFTNELSYTEQEMSSILKYLTEIQTWCEENGKIFLFFIAPDKNKIYGEYYPRSIKKVRPDSQSRTRQFISYAKEHSSVSIVYPINELLLEKEKGNLLYYKNDTHWDDMGAYIGYMALAKELQKSVSFSPLEVTEWEYRLHEQGDLNNLYPGGTKKDKKTLYPYVKFEKIYKVDEERSQDERLTGYFTYCENGNLKAAVFRDSFGSAMKQFISNDFSEVQYYRRSDIKAKNLENLTNTDVIIFEIVERNLPWLILKSL